MLDLAIQNRLWVAILPAVGLQSTLPLVEETNLSYMDHILFAADVQSLKHITHFSVFLSRESAGIQGFQTHFDDREPIPKHIAWYGKGVPMLIDGAAGERLYKIKASWSNVNRCAGLTVRTTSNHCLNLYVPLTKTATHQ